MKKANFTLLYFVLLLLFSCSQNKAPQEKTTVGDLPKKEILDLQNLLDSFQVTGGILIYDLTKNTYLSNDFARAEQGFLPASTFKIPNSIIGIESGFIQEDHLFEWDGASRGMKIWEKDLDLKGAYDASCVPCYQELARGVGLEKMQEWTQKLNFGKMEVTSDNLDLFWLRGNSRVSQMEEVDFLKRLHLKELPIKKNTYQIMRDLMIREQTEEYVLRAKTGLSANGDIYNGWFVGYLEKGESAYFFATNLDPLAQTEYKKFIKARVLFTEEVLKQLGYY